MLFPTVGGPITTSLRTPWGVVLRDMVVDEVWCVNSGFLFEDLFCGV